MLSHTDNYKIVYEQGYQQGCQQGYQQGFTVGYQTALSRYYNTINSNCPCTYLILFVIFAFFIKYAIIDPFCI
jgi:hypothetical protein